MCTNQTALFESFICCWAMAIAAAASAAALPAFDPTDPDPPPVNHDIGKLLVLTVVVAVVVAAGVVVVVEAAPAVEGVGVDTPKGTAVDT